MVHNQSPTSSVLGMAGRQTDRPGNNIVTGSGIYKGQEIIARATWSVITLKYFALQTSVFIPCFLSQVVNLTHWGRDWLFGPVFTQPLLGCVVVLGWCLCRSIHRGKCEFQQWRRMVWYKLLGLYQGHQAKIAKREFRMSANKSFCKSLSKIVWQPTGETAGAPQLGPNPM